jgi:hypothetical protein
METASIHTGICHFAHKYIKCIVNGSDADYLQQMLIMWHLAVNSTFSKTLMYSNHPARVRGCSL